LTKKLKDMDSKTMRILVAIDGSEPAGLAVDLPAPSQEGREHAAAGDP
jgi:nucleotide-binding universal stress UspA family protein